MNETLEQKGEHDTQFTKYITLKKEFRWLLQDAFTKLREGFQPVDNRRFLSEDKDQKANFTNSPPHTRTFSPEQVDTFFVVFDAMEKEQASYPAEIDRDTISGEILKQRLVESGKFKDLDEAAMIIIEMQKFKQLERVSLDTYRRRSSNSKK